jgi:exonuclease III
MWMASSAGLSSTPGPLHAYQTCNVTCTKTYYEAPDINAASVLIRLAAAAAARCTAEEAAHLDGQGRCVITDHGLFVLVNAYLPACSNVIEQNRRAQFKVGDF